MKRFITTYEKDGWQYSGFVDALDWQHAQTICDQRDLGEKVEGVLYLIVEDCTPEQADQITEMMANTDMGEAPEAETFDAYKPKEKVRDYTGREVTREEYLMDPLNFIEFPETPQ